MGPAASVNTNIEDMAQWLKFQLSGKNTDGNRLVSEANFKETHLSQIAVPDVEYDKFSEFTPTHYAFAWSVQKYRGTRLIRHGGSIGGFLSTVATLPDLDAGVVILQNNDSFGINSYIALRIYDLLLEKNPIDWLARLHGDDPQSVDALSLNAEEQLHVESVKNEQILSVNKIPPLPLEGFTGNFEHPGYGKIRVFEENKQLKLSYNDWTVEMKPIGGTSFQCVGWYSDKATFAIDKSGKVTAVSLPFEPTVADIRFEKQ
jgi:hypothetical protein